MLSVEVTSHETIKPSSPTPPHLRSMPVCVIDQMAWETYVHVILFFQADGTAPAAKAALLKDSLSNTLTHFYPLAGRLSGDFLQGDAHVNCNDEGVEFYEATAVEGCFDAILSRPPMKELYRLMPKGGVKFQQSEPLLAVQLNAFACGGIALGIWVTHKLAGATSFALFLNNWGEAARGVELQISSLPLFHAASVLPRALPRQVMELQNADGSLTKRFVIRGPEIDKLREDAAYARSQFPTRVEAVVALLWRCIIHARSTKGSHDKGRIPVSLFPVNLRKRMPGELPDTSFGNLLALAIVAEDGMAGKGTGRDRQASLEQRVRDAFRKVDGDYVREQMEGLVSGENPLPDTSRYDVMTFTSWCRMSFYATDFGWGEPAWYCALMRNLLNVIVLGDTKDGRGVEVWLWLADDDMGMLVSDSELREFVDPESISY